MDKKLYVIQNNGAGKSDSFINLSRDQASALRRKGYRVEDISDAELSQEYEKITREGGTIGGASL